MTTALFNNLGKTSKFDLINKLQDQGISTRPFFDPLSSLKAYKGSPDQIRAQHDNKNSYDISARGINLPSAASIDKKDVKKIIQILRNKYD